MILIFRWSKWIVRRAWILENSLCIWIHRSSTFVIPETGMTCFPASMDLCIGFVQRRWILDYRVKTLCADVTQEASEKCEAGLRPWEFGLKGKTSKGKWEKDTHSLTRANTQCRSLTFTYSRVRTFSQKEFAHRFFSLRALSEMATFRIDQKKAVWATFVRSHCKSVVIWRPYFKMFQTKVFCIESQFICALSVAIVILFITTNCPSHTRVNRTSLGLVCQCVASIHSWISKNNLLEGLRLGI